MDKLHAMRVFARVVEANSFSKAADTLGLPRATVTTTIQNLEAALGVRLLQRTTRRLGLTPDGAAYLEGAQRILAEVDEIEAGLVGSRANPRGRLRVDMPGSIGRLVVIPAIREFHRLYPDVEVMIGMGDRPVDLIQDGVDCVIRVGELADSTLVARRVGALQFVTCASPAYLEEHGEPLGLDDLEHHKAVNYFSGRNGRLISMSFRDGEGDGEREIPLKGTVSVNDADAYLTCGLEGLGLIQTPRFMALPHLQRGALREVLHRYRPSHMPVSAVYPHSRHLSPKVRVFVDWVAALFERCPLLQGQEIVVDACTPGRANPLLEPDGLDVCDCVL